MARRQAGLDTARTMPMSEARMVVDNQDLAHEVMFVMAAEQECGAHLRRRMQPVIVGVGPIEAAIGTALALQRRSDSGRKPKLVVSLGSAGSHRCAVGSIWQISGVSWRDMDASRLGFEKGVTPFCDHPAEIALPTPLPGIPTATLSTGGQVIGDEDYQMISADLVDMETFAVARACQRFGIPMIGLRGVSDGPGTLSGIHDWTGMLALLDARLAEAVDLIPLAMARLHGVQPAEGP
jgi:adenosylhomocysteine nucleosidase